jgi:hypothetical protein
MNMSAAEDVVKFSALRPETSVLARIAELASMDAPSLKARWRELFDTEPPPYNRRFLESRLAYRIQELTYGGLRPGAIERLEHLGDHLDGGSVKKRKTATDGRLLPGTRLLREWQGVEHTVTVLSKGYDFEGRPYKSLTAIARAITGKSWNGWTFFGLTNPDKRP